jgi:hypothetical protein
MWIRTDADLGPESRPHPSTRIKFRIAMNLTARQHHQLKLGKPVEVDVDGEPCVLLTRHAFDRVKGSEVEASNAAGDHASVSDLIGAWRTDGGPTDEEIERILEEERIRKHA